ncbi:hypothetical protein U3516DRAFT_813585 [Neocallimastix sp. 'constans']|jgi:uncharacterized Zn finger protein (UPF0148 family)
MDSFEQRHERGITNMGELLLKGYIMSADSCPNCNCVLFKKSKNSPLFCPICDDKKDKNDTKKNKMNNKNNQSLQYSESKITDTKPTETGSKENVTNQINSVNNKMSELLLAGWTLTNDNCPFCIGVPLMRNKEKLQYCVKCEKNFVSEEEAKKQNLIINNSKIGNNVLQVENNIPQKENNTSSLEKNFMPPTKKENLSVNYNDEIKLECSKTSTVLLHQLTSLRNKLEVMNENNDNMIPNTQYTVQICDAISSVCNALNACNSILYK